MMGNPQTTNDIINTTCCVCGHQGNKHMFDGKDERFRVDEKMYSIVRCQHCGLARLDPRPADHALGRYYPASFYTPRFIESPKRNLNTWRKKRHGEKTVAEKLRIIHAHIQPPGLLVDIGCAAGEFLAHARANNWQVCGVEFDPNTAARTRESLKIDVRTGSIDDVELPHNVNVCTFWASLEHMPDPLGALKKARQSLAPDGIIVVLVPNFGSWEARVAGNKWPHLDIPRHLYHFEPSTLKTLAEAAGLRVLEINTPRTSLSNSHWPTALLGGWRPRSRRSQRIVNSIFIPISEILSGIASPMRANHTLIGVFTSDNISQL
ncbi:MAG TPA: class I SAM-dependent methyltransferase [Gammaproteobacteria bacterium]